MAELAQSFVAADYRLKELLADMLLSPWYRGSGVADADAAKFRAVELATVGSGRLLTQKNLTERIALFLAEPGATQFRVPTHAPNRAGRSEQIQNLLRWGRQCRRD